MTRQLVVGLFALGLVTTGCLVCAKPARTDASNHVLSNGGHNPNPQCPMIACEPTRFGKDGTVMTGVNTKPCCMKRLNLSCNSSPGLRTPFR
jgi:hypothetical protein